MSLYPRETIFWLTHVVCSTDSYTFGIGSYILAFIANDYLGRQTTRFVQDFVNGSFSIVTSILVVRLIYAASARPAIQDRELQGTIEDTHRPGRITINATITPIVAGTLAYTSQVSIIGSLGMLSHIFHMFTVVTYHVIRIATYCYSFTYSLVEKTDGLKMNGELIFVGTLFTFIVLPIFVSVFRLVNNLPHLREKGKQI